MKTNVCIVLLFSWANFFVPASVACAQDIELVRVMPYDGEVIPKSSTTHKFHHDSLNEVSVTIERVSKGNVTLAVAQGSQQIYIAEILQADFLLDLEKVKLGYSVKYKSFVIWLDARIKFPTSCQQGRELWPATLTELITIYIGEEKASWNVLGFDRNCEEAFEREWTTDLAASFSYPTILARNPR